MSLTYRCTKCGNEQCETAEMRGADGFWSKIFDVQGQRYSTVTCTRCKFTEFYKAPTSMLGNIFDLFTN
jgi:predicted nucleic-acid-binding Zn-ribbon protein